MSRQPNTHQARAVNRKKSEKIDQANCRPAFPFNARRQCERALCAPPALSAAFDYFWRWR